MCNPSFVLDDQLVDQIADALVDSGYIVLPHALPMQLVDKLLERLHELDDEEFKRAGIGRQDDFQIDTSVRRDHIRWLQPKHPVEIEFLAWMDNLRLALNRRLFMGLMDYECHFASYGVGAFYKKHLDAFKRPTPLLQSTIQISPLQVQPSRVLSTVLYLNPDWQEGDGGELRLYDEEDVQVLETIAPQFGKLVLFLSEKFPHEVLVAKRKRHSIAGWFRVNAS